MYIWRPVYDDCPDGGCTRTSILLTYGEESVELKLPEPDSYELQLNPSIQYTRGVELRYAKVTFPTFRVLHYTFENITKGKRDEFMAFYKLTAGLQIVLTDYCNQQWVGVILNRTITSIQKAIRTHDVDLEECDDLGGIYTLNFDFEGMIGD